MFGRNGGTSRPSQLSAGTQTATATTTCAGTQASAHTSSSGIQAVATASSTGPQATAYVTGAGAQTVAARVRLMGFHFHAALTRIQACFRGFYVRGNFEGRKQATMTITPYNARPLPPLSTGRPPPENRRRRSCRGPPPVPGRGQGPRDLGVPVDRAPATRQHGRRGGTRRPVGARERPPPPAQKQPPRLTTAEQGEAAPGRDNPVPPDPAGRAAYLSVAKGKPTDSGEKAPPDSTPPFASRWTEIQQQVDAAMARRQDVLAKAHPFRDRGAWHLPSRRHANGKRRALP